MAANHVSMDQEDGGAPSVTGKRVYRSIEEKRRIVELTLALGQVWRE